MPQFQVEDTEVLDIWWPHGVNWGHPKRIHRDTRELPPHLDHFRTSCVPPFGMRRDWHLPSTEDQCIIVLLDTSTPHCVVEKVERRPQCSTCAPGVPPLFCRCTACTFLAQISFPSASFTFSCLWAHHPPAPLSQGNTLPFLCLLQTMQPRKKLAEK